MEGYETANKAQKEICMELHCKITITKRVFFVLASNYETYVSYKCVPNVLDDSV